MATDQTEQLCGLPSEPCYLTGKTYSSLLNAWLILSMLHISVLWGRGLKVSVFTEMVSVSFSGVVTKVPLAKGNERLPP